MSQEKLYFYIITIIWSYIIALIGPMLFLGRVNPDGNGRAIAEFFFSNFFFLSTYILTGRTEIETFIINMCSTLIIGIIMSWIITKLAVQKEYANREKTEK